MKIATKPPVTAGQPPGNEAGEVADWQADWEGHRRWQLTAALEATPAQRLAWLEEMLELAYRSGALAGPPPQMHAEPQRRK